MLDQKIDFQFLVSQALICQGACIIFCQPSSYGRALVCVAILHKQPSKAKELCTQTLLSDQSICLQLRTNNMGFCDDATCKFGKSCEQLACLLSKNESPSFLGQCISKTEQIAEDAHCRYYWILKDLLHHSVCFTDKSVSDQSRCIDP